MVSARNLKPAGAQSPRFFRSCHVSRIASALFHTSLRFSDGFICPQRPPPPPPRRISDPLGVLAPPDRASAAAAEFPTKPRSSNLNIVPSSSKLSKGAPDPRAKTPVRTPVRELRGAAVVTPHAAARDRERLRARERAQVPARRITPCCLRAASPRAACAPHHPVLPAR
jgi:hypothetical protein